MNKILVHQEFSVVVEYKLESRGYYYDDGGFHSYPGAGLEFTHSIGEGSADTPDSNSSIFLKKLFYPLVLAEITYHKSMNFDS